MSSHISFGSVTADIACVQNTSLQQPSSGVNLWHGKMIATRRKAGTEERARNTHSKHTQNERERGRNTVAFSKKKKKRKDVAYIRMEPPVCPPRERTAHQEADEGYRKAETLKRSPNKAFYFFNTQ
jgi:hypothetical protein